ncbi:MAG: hypothetical protein AB8F34_07745 [Akkermansiaceae bacterium]
MKTTKLTIRNWAVALLSAAAISATASAEVATVKDALAVALKNETIAAAGDKMKLYSLNGNYNGATKRWSFQFYDGGANIHSVSVDKAGKARYYSRDKGSMRIFDDIDWTKLPAPNDVLIEDLLGQATAALAALKFETIDNGKIYMNYYVRSEYRQKDKAYHAWSVTLPLKEAKKGKTVGFKDGKIDTIMTSTLYGG